MASTAILGFAHQVSVQQVNAAGTPFGPIVVLQSTKVNPKKTRGKIDMTNALSPPGKAEFAPGVQHGQFSIAGIVDAGVLFDLVFTTIIDSALFSQVLLYITKPTGLNNPLIYTGLCLWTDAELDIQTSQEGAVNKFTASGVLSGSFIRSGNDTTYVTGASS